MERIFLFESEECVGIEQVIAKNKNECQHKNVFPQQYVDQTRHYFPLFIVKRTKQQNNERITTQDHEFIEVETNGTVKMPVRDPGPYGQHIHARKGIEKKLELPFGVKSPNV
jgi:hypothetical protein